MNKRKYNIPQHRRGNNSLFVCVFVVIFAIQTWIFPAVLETTSLTSDNLCQVKINLSTLPDESISGVQLECIYDNTNWKLENIIAEESIANSGKVLQYSDIYGQLRIIIIGFNNTLIPSGTLCEMIFTPVTEQIPFQGFYITQIVFTSPNGTSVPGNVKNNTVTEGEINTDLSAEGEKAENTTSENRTETSSSETLIEPEKRLEYDVNNTSIQHITQDNMHKPESFLSNHNQNISQTEDTISQTQIMTKDYELLNQSGYGYLPPTFGDDNISGKIQNITHSKQQLNTDTRKETNYPKFVNSNNNLLPRTISQREDVYNSYQNITSNEDSVSRSITSKPVGEKNLTGRQNTNVSILGALDAKTTDIYKEYEQDASQVYPNDKKHINSSISLALDIPYVSNTKGRIGECITIETKRSSTSDITTFQNVLIILSIAIIGTLFLLTSSTILLQYIPTWNKKDSSNTP